MDRTGQEELQQLLNRLQNAYNLAKSTGRLRPEGASEEEKEQSAAEWERILTRCGITGRYRNCTFDALERTAIPANIRAQFREVKAYAREFNRHLAEGTGLILWGPVGTMKTSLAVAVLHEIIAAGRRGYIITMPSLLDTIFTLKENNIDEWINFENRLRDTPLLILDDFGGEYHTPWVLNKVDAIISERYNRLRPVIITTNLSGDAMRSAYAERIIDRLRSTCRMLTFTGPSLRLVPPHS